MILTKKTIMNIYQKLAAVKTKIGKLTKDQTNPFYESKYFDVNGLIEQLEPLFEANGLLLLQPIQNGCLTTEIVDIETGDSVNSQLALPELNDPQKIGSAITYYRRYTLQSLLGLQAEDDDAETANGRGKTVPKDNNRPEPSKWLNQKDKQGNVTPEWQNIIDGINNGKITDPKEVRNYYKVGKAVYAELEQLFNALA